MAEMNTLQLSNLKYARNKRLHECPGAYVRLYQQEDIYILCHCLCNV